MLDSYGERNALTGWVVTAAEQFRSSARIAVAAVATPTATAQQESNKNRPPNLYAHLDVYDALVALHLQIVQHELREHDPRPEVKRVVEQKLQSGGGSGSKSSNNRFVERRVGSRNR